MSDNKTSENGANGLAEITKALFDEPQAMSNAKSGPPIPEFHKASTVACKPVKYDPEFRKVGAENQWATRRDRGLPWTTDIFEYLEDVYKQWIGKGMTQADLLVVDKKGWTALQNRLRTEKLPETLPLLKKATPPLLISLTKKSFGIGLRLEN